MRVVGYVYQADVYCPACTVVLVSGDPDFWTIDEEDALDRFAEAEGINRDDETTFDSDDFPKVLFSDSLDGEVCGRCSYDL